MFNSDRRIFAEDVLDYIFLVEYRCFDDEFIVFRLFYVENEVSYCKMG